MNSNFLKACRGEQTEFTPIWLHRQAGRYMPDYHALKGDTPSLKFFTTPDLAARATLDAQRILGVDAAIMFADLLPLLVPMGLDLDYKQGVGPIIDNPVRNEDDIEKLAVTPPEEGTGYIVETIRQILEGLPADIPLIGFAGAPFTLASYAIEGKGVRSHIRVKQLMYGVPELWDKLMAKLVDTIRAYVSMQIDSGVHAVQLFDSWVGCLSTADYARYVKPHMKRLVAGIGDRVPIIYFGTGNGHLVDLMFETGPDFLSLDWRTPMVSTWDRLAMVAVQGNMDPIALCADRDTVAIHAGRILREVGGRPGHIFNLGHGIVPETPVDNVKYLVDFVHEHSKP